jgi:hypothetical protein
VSSLAPADRLYYDIVALVVEILKYTYSIFSENMINVTTLQYHGTPIEFLNILYSRSIDPDGLTYIK